MLILASNSMSRKDLLESAGVTFKSIASDIDENHLKKKFHLDGMTSKEASLELAILKAKEISKNNPLAYVIGSDQLLDLNGKWFSKPKNTNEAHKHLKKLRNKTHSLVSGTVVLKNSKMIWFNNSIAKITMRDFSDNFIQDYIDKAGEDICYSVGAYFIEDLGAQLIKSYEGDYFSILGLPMIELLECLRQCGEIKK